jgi:hypothetical protein
MDHLPFVIAQDIGAEGFQLHGGTIDCSSGEYSPHLAYTCHNGHIRSALLGCNGVYKHIFVSLLLCRLKDLDSMN